jgi:hypothetical protein
VLAADGLAFGLAVGPRTHVLRVHGNYKDAMLPAFRAVFEATMDGDDPVIRGPSTFPHDGTFLGVVTGDELLQIVLRPARTSFAVTDAYISIAASDRRSGTRSSRRLQTRRGDIIPAIGGYLPWEGVRCAYSAVSGCRGWASPTSEGANDREVDAAPRSRRFVALVVGRDPCRPRRRRPSMLAGAPAASTSPDIRTIGYRRVKVRWVTPLGDETASMS